jgi:hypothetical protein
VKAKPYKMQNQSIICEMCHSVIDREKDFFKLELNWAIKKKADIKNFCSLRCVKEWCTD